MLRDLLTERIQIKGRFITFDTLEEVLNALMLTHRGIGMRCVPNA